ncbi:hypothetical protein [Klebsiella aerogenes]|uniref:hypothetical protein n=1 Tax=Klebsiella aerogenes TaxID=548 RepID=UPI00062C4D69|nr:hypothetical protein [Klebsiella aerogenes]KKY64134.1 hypothetical protein OA41_20310 [Klebsiella aerogenes]
MLDLMQDNNGVIITGGDLIIDGGVDGIAQQCEIRVGMNKGEWWLDESIGIPWFYGVMGQKLPADIVGKMVAEEGVKTEGVTDVRITRAANVGGKVAILFDVYVGQESKGIAINGN